MSHSRSGHTDEAVRFTRKAIGQFDRLLPVARHDTRLLKGVIRGYGTTALILQSKGVRDEAERVFRKKIDGMRMFVEVQPRNEFGRDELALELSRFGRQVFDSSSGSGYDECKEALANWDRPGGRCDTPAMRSLCHSIIVIRQSRIGQTSNAQQSLAKAWELLELSTPNGVVGSDEVNALRLYYLAGGTLAAALSDRKLCEHCITLLEFIQADGDVWADAGWLYACCHSLAAQDKSLPPVVRNKLCDHYAKLSISRLRMAVAHNRPGVAKLLKEVEIAGLQLQPDFQLLLNDINMAK